MPGLPLAPLGALDSLLLGFVAQVAAWFGRPRWAVLDLTLSGPLEVAAAYALLLAATALALRGLGRLARRPKRTRRHAPVAPGRPPPAAAHRGALAGWGERRAEHRPAG